MTQILIFRWYLVHKWSSLISTLFLLVLCVTGLPLIFYDEINAALGDDWDTQLAGSASAEMGVSLDTIVAEALEQQPGEVPLFIGFSQDSSLITVTTGPTPGAADDAMTLLYFDRATGDAAGAAAESGVMHTVLDLHTDLLLGLPGMFFLGAMGVLFVVAIVSGIVLYAPFMRRLRFGTLRTSRSVRVATLDRHNLLGIVTMGWALVVGLTGVINAFGDPVTDSWRDGELRAMTASYTDKAPLAPADYGSLDIAMASAQSALPGVSPQFIGFPGGGWSSGHHYAIFLQGATPLTSNLLTAALVDAGTGKLTDAHTMPALNQALMLSKPLHFGDYGGLTLKVVWALLDLATIWVLSTGIRLWLRRDSTAIKQPVAEIVSGAMNHERST